MDLCRRNLYKITRMKKTFLLFALLVATTTLTAAVEDLLPQPQTMVTGKGKFAFNAQTTYRITTPSATDSEELTALIDSWQWTVKRSDTHRAKNQIDIRVEPQSKIVTAEEGYRLDVTPHGVVIRARSIAGAYYALQTLHQLTGDQPTEVAALRIDDAPRFPYRGFMLDVSRHFRSKAFVLRQIDAMARFKLNRLHLHLTDGAGWRIEIKAYPHLTEQGAWRPYKSYMEWFHGDRNFCTADHPLADGGFYTQDDIREIVAYARRHQITIIPEIEMPSHSEEVIACYPELSCSGRYDGGEFCPGNDAVFTFFEQVLTEVMELFPSQYIHIGGDEAGKGAWRTCPKCQARMQAEGLQSVEELQSYFIHRIERFIDSKGRRMIGWDEILEGGLAPNATIMSWRGTHGGMEAVRAGHDAIMTPGEFCYIDHAQDAPFTQPLSIGGYLPLRKVYSYDPTSECTDASQRARILGVQANLWTEYVPTDSHCERMIWPRLTAIAEIGWSQPERMDYDSFRQRTLRAMQGLQRAGYTPFDLEKEYGERPESLQPTPHLGVGKKVIYRQPYADQYRAGGDTALTDGVIGGWTYGDRRWQGTMGKMDLVIDMERPTQMHYIGATFMQSTGPWVTLPAKVEIGISDDGEHFTAIATLYNDVPAACPDLIFRPFAYTGNVTGRYIRFQAENNRPQKGWWLFTDEIVVF